MNTFEPVLTEVYYWYDLNFPVENIESPIDAIADRLDNDIYVKISNILASQLKDLALVHETSVYYGIAVKLTLVSDEISQEKIRVALTKASKLVWNMLIKYKEFKEFKDL